MSPVLRASSAREAMAVELPDISGLAHDRGSQPCAFDGICGIRGFLLEIADDLIDFDGLEARDRNVEILIDKEFGEFGQLHGKELPIPARILGDLIVGKEQRPFFRLAQAFEYDHWYLA
jgi:hypothetical protein